MKIATLQLDPRIGEVKKNIALAESLLEATNLKGVQLLVAPELALTGKPTLSESNQVFVGGLIRVKVTISVLYRL